MLKNQKSVIWDPGELIYEAGSLPKEAYLILEGYVNIETKDGLKLNRLGIGEIFGETSIRNSLVPKRFRIFFLFASVNT